MNLQIDDDDVIIRFRESEGEEGSERELGKTKM